MSNLENMTFRTEYIVKKLQKNEISLDDLINDTRLPSLSGCLNELMGKRDISTEVTAELAGINRASLYKIMSGDMNPSRNTLLRLGLALQISFEEMQVLLKCGNCAALSGSRKRDILLINAVIKKQSIDDVNQSLIDNGFMSLYSRG